VHISIMSVDQVVLWRRVLCRECQIIESPIMCAMTLQARQLKKT